MESTDLIAAIADAVAARVVAHFNISAPPPSPALDDWMRTAQAAVYVKLSTKSLETKRRVGGGPKFEKNGRRIRYRRADLDEWLGSKRAGKRAERDDAIREAHAKGLSYTEIGKQLGISRQRAKQIVAGGKR